MPAYKSRLACEIGSLCARVSQTTEQALYHYYHRAINASRDHLLFVKDSLLH